MGMSKPDIHPNLQLRRTSGVFDHFNEYVSGSGHLWTSATSTGTVALATTGLQEGGILLLTSGAVAGQYAAVQSTAAMWKFVAGKPMIFQTAFSYTEEASNLGVIFCGFTNDITAVLTSATGVPIAANSGTVSACGIYKIPGDTTWSVLLINGTTRLLVPTSSKCQNAAAMQEFIIQVMIPQANIIEATFWQGGLGAPAVTTGAPGGPTPMYPLSPGPAFQPVKLTAALTGAAAMKCGVISEAGTAAAAGQALSVDYIGTELLSIP